MTANQNYNKIEKELTPCYNIPIEECKKYTDCRQCLIARICNAGYLHASDFLQMVKNICKYETCLCYETIEKGVLRQMKMEVKNEKNQ